MEGTKIGRSLPAELQKDSFCPVSQFSTEKCPNHAFGEICNDVRYKSKLSLVFWAEHCHKLSFCILFRPSIIRIIQNDYLWHSSTQKDYKWVENKYTFTFMHHILTKLTKCMIRTFFRWKSGYWTKIIFCNSNITSW